MWSHAVYKNEVLLYTCTIIIVVAGSCVYALGVGYYKGLCDTERESFVAKLSEHIHTG